ncbi:hypothetical protein JW707_03670 [Candidatus Woesearchaeota archaeon]|nr:hypothetical protein [Candidatus Woesearchaeota archaeon]
MIFKRQARSKKAQTVQIIIMLVVGLIVVGIMIYLGYKYILGTGKDVGELGSCEGQGGKCVAKGANCPADVSPADKFQGMGCKGETPTCCMPQQRT